MLTLTKDTDLPAAQIIGIAPTVTPSREESALVFTARAFLQRSAVFEAALVAPMKVLITPDDRHSPYAFTNALRHMWLVQPMLGWIDAKRLAFIMAHEALHAALGDAVRLSAPEVVRSVAAIATDLRINGILMQRIRQGASALTVQGFKFWDMNDALKMLADPANAETPEQPSKANPSLPITGWGDPDLCEESVESIYTRLLAALPPDQQGEAAKRIKSDVHVQAKPEAGEGDADKEDDSESDGDGGAMSAAAIGREMASRLASAAIAEQAHQKNKGRAVDSFTSRFVDSSLKPNVDWRAKLLRLIGKHLARDDYSMRRPNRRAMMRGVITASLRSDMVKRLAVVCDTSGSVSNAELARQASEVASIVARAKVKEVHVAFVDTDVRATQVFKRGQRIEFKPAGGGGTDFRPGVEWAMELKPDAIIYFTDGYGTFPDRAPRVPMIWVAVGRHTIQDSDFPFGDVVRIDR